MVKSNYRYTLKYPEFLYNKYGNFFINLESAWLHFLDQLAGHNKDNDYSSFKLAINKDDDDVFYFKIDGAKTFDCQWPFNYSEGALSSDSLSLTAMIFSVSYLIEKVYKTNNELANKLVELKYKLMDEAEKSKQSKLIFKFID